MNFLVRVTLYRTTIALLVIFLSACSEIESPPSDAPANVTVTEGSGLVVVDWDTVAGRTYWIFYKEGTDVSLTNFDRILQEVIPPYALSGLSNTIQYAFSVTSSNGSSKVGPFSPVITTTPRLLSPSITWTVGTPLDAGADANVNNLQSIAFGNNTYVTVGDYDVLESAATVFAAPYDYTSPGGVTAWSAATTLPGGLANLSSVVYDGSRFVALGDDGSIIKSTDTEALIWEAATAIGATNMNALAYGVGTYVAVGNGGAIHSNTSDGVTAAWTMQTSGTSNDLLGVSYINGTFIAVGASGTISTSTDGATWSPLENIGNSSLLRGVAYGANTYVVVGDTVAAGDEGTIVSSPDAITWTEQSIPTIGGIPITESFRAVSFGPDAQFVAVGTMGVLAYSSTGADGSWAISNAGTADLNAMAPSLPPTPLYIAVGASGTNVSGK